MDTGQIAMEDQSTSEPESVQSGKIQPEIESKTKRKLNKALWKHYEVVDEKTAMCKHCKKNIKTPTSTTCLILHIQRCHVTEYTEYLAEKTSQSSVKLQQGKNSHEAKNQKTLTSMFSKTTPLDSSSNEAKKATNLIAHMLVSSFLPYRFVEEQGFRDLIHNLKPNYEVPSSTTFEKCCAYLCKQKKKSNVSLKKILPKLVPYVLIFF